MERTCENCEYKYEWVDCIQCCDCSCHNRWKPNSELSNFAIEELKNMKDEISHLVYFTYNEIEKLIDNRIMELEGEE